MTQRDIFRNRTAIECRSRRNHGNWNLARWRYRHRRRYWCRNASTGYWRRVGRRIRSHRWLNRWPQAAIDDDPMRALTTAFLLFGFALLGTSAYAQEARPDATATVASAQSAAATKARIAHQGIWKSAVPPIKMKGMFQNHDPIGLVAGKLIPADCSLNWTDPDTHGLYCFSSATSLVYFLDSPQTYLAQAEKNWRVLKGKPEKVRRDGAGRPQ